MKKPLLLFPLTFPMECILFLFKYIAYVNLNFRCYGYSKHPKMIQKRSKRDNKYLKTSEKNPKEIGTKNYPKKIKNIQKTPKIHPKQI